MQNESCQMDRHFLLVVEIGEMQKALRISKQISWVAKANDLKKKKKGQGEEKEDEEWGKSTVCWEHMAVRNVQCAQVASCVSNFPHPSFR